MFHARSLFVAALALSVSTSLHAQSGAVFTTNKDGNAVNGNTYKKADQVYLSASGLADDDYYFQVTNSSGTECLSTDGIEDRRVTVSGGVITAASKHALGSAGKGNKGGSPNSVQLVPFDTTGGVYKVWMTPVGRYVANTGTCGFFPTYSKTDNFKVEGGKPQAQTIITGTVFYDTSEDNCQDTGEPGLAGWRVEIRKKGEESLVGTDFTVAGGEYKFIVPLDGTTYSITVLAPVFDENGDVITNRADGFIGESAAARWLASDGCVYVDPVADVEFRDGPDFGNVYFVPADTSATGKLVYGIGFWHNTSGKAILAAKDDPSSPDPTWREILTTIANPFDTPPPADPNYPLDWPYDCFTAESVAVSLRDNQGKIFAPLAYPSEGDNFEAAFSGLSTWLVADDLGHAAFKLSREIAAAILNVKCGNLKGTTVYVDPDPSDDDLNLVSFDELVYRAVCLLLRPALAEFTGPQATGDALLLRNAILGCLNEFGGVNTSSTGTEEEVYVYEPEPDPTAAPEPEEPYDPTG